jgi:hypothetical protein
MKNLRDLPELYQACLRTAAQGKRARRLFPDGATCCAYDDGDGNACAVGQCLTPELRTSVASYRGTVGGLMGRFPEARAYLHSILRGHPAYILDLLQEAHDSTPEREAWAQRFWQRFGAALHEFLIVPPWHEVAAEVAAIKEGKHEDATPSPQ